MSGKAIWIAVVLILVGAVLFVSVLAEKDFDFTRLDNRVFETNTHVIDTAFTGIEIDASTADVTLLPSTDGTCRVVCFETEKETNLVEVKDGKLTVKRNDRRKWYDYIGIHFRTPSITVYLPETAYGAFTVHMSTGDVLISREFTFASIAVSGSTGDVSCYASAEGEISVALSTGDLRLEALRAGSIRAKVSTGSVKATQITCAGAFEARTTTGSIMVEQMTCAGAVVANVSTGRVTLTGVTCASLASEGSTGNLSMTDVIATECFTVERDTGDVHMERCDAQDILIGTDTGNVKGILLSEKRFVASSSTGRVRVPEGTDGGRCEVRTSTGNITFTVE